MKTRQLTIDTVLTVLEPTLDNGEIDWDALEDDPKPNIAAQVKAELEAAEAVITTYDDDGVSGWQAAPVPTPSPVPPPKVSSQEETPTAVEPPPKRGRGRPRRTEAAAAAIVKGAAAIEPTTLIKQGIDALEKSGWVVHFRDHSRFERGSVMIFDDQDLEVPETAGRPLPFHGLDHTTTLRLHSVREYKLGTWNGVIVDGYVIRSNRFEPGIRRSIVWIDLADYVAKLQTLEGLDSATKKKKFQAEKTRRRSFWCSILGSPKTLVADPGNPDLKIEEIVQLYARATIDGVLERDPHDVRIIVTEGANGAYTVEFATPGGDQ